MKKLIVTGATGFVGKEIMRQLALRADVDRVLALTRRPFATGSTKVEVRLHADFDAYDDALVNELSDYDGCLWALGGKVSDAEDPGGYERSTHGFTLRFARAVAERLGHAFRFCYLSGMGADPTESAWLPWEKTTRHLKGRVERDLAALAKEQPRFGATAFRPGGILEHDGLKARLLAPIAITVEDIARAMIDEAVAPPDLDFRVLSNADSRRVARSERPMLCSTTQA